MAGTRHTILSINIALGRFCDREIPALSLQGLGVDMVGVWRLHYIVLLGKSFRMQDLSTAANHSDLWFSDHSFRHGCLPVYPIPSIQHQPSKVVYRYTYGPKLQHTYRACPSQCPHPKRTSINQHDAAVNSNRTQTCVTTTIYYLYVQI